LWLEDDYPEHDNGIITGNAEVIDHNCAEGEFNTCSDPIGGGCVVGSTGGQGPRACEHCGNCGVPPSDYSKCNPNIAGNLTHFFVARNTWTGDCISNPLGWNGVFVRQPDRWGSTVRPLRAQPNLPELPWEEILSWVGPVNRNAREQAVIDYIKSRLP
jgi:hypothetical protein